MISNYAIIEKKAFPLHKNSIEQGMVKSLNYDCSTIGVVMIQIIEIKSGKVLRSVRMVAGNRPSEPGVYLTRDPMGNYNRMRFDGRKWTVWSEMYKGFVQSPYAFVPIVRMYGLLQKDGVNLH